MLALQQTLKLQIRLGSRMEMNLFHENYEFKFQFIGTKVLLSPVQEDNLYVHVLPVLVEEVLEEVGD